MQTMISGTLVQVGDLDRAIDFYSRFFGAEVVQKNPGQSAELKIGQSRLDFIVGGRGLSLSMTASDLDGMRDALTRSGCDCMEDGDGFTIADPDGNQIRFRSAAPHDPNGPHGVPWNPQDREEDRGVG